MQDIRTIILSRELRAYCTQKRTEQRALEERYNQYHDPRNGRFTTGTGGGGGYLFVVPKGQRGKGILMNDMGISDKGTANAYYNGVYDNSSINGLTPSGLSPNPHQPAVVNGANQTNTTTAVEETTGTKFGVYGGRGTAYTIVTVDGENKVIRNDYIEAQADGTLLISEKSLAIPRQSAIMDVSDDIKNSEHSSTPASIAGVAKGNPMTFEEADNGASNPRYDQGTYGVTHNCQTCVVAHEARMRGYDVEAKARSSSNGYQVALAYDTASGYIDPVTNQKPKLTPISSRQTAYNEMDAIMQQGERYELEFRHASGGHIITVSKTDTGELQLYDPQTNKKASGRTEIASYFDERMARDISVLRVDNLDFNQKVLDNVLKKNIKKGG